MHRVAARLSNPSRSPAPLPVHGIPVEQLAALPALPGVYQFHAGGDPVLPLYVGKSINLRARVLSHLRDPAEARMMAQVRRVSWTRTAGEIGALLLESRLIKATQPLYNQRLRRSRELLSWRWSDSPAPGAPLLALVGSREIDFARSDGLVGLFSSASSARGWLLQRAQAQRLCLVCLGLEAAAPRGCFGLQLGRCDGVCVGREPAAVHAARVRAALAPDQVQRWPFRGAIGLVERDGDWTQTHVVRDWAYLHTSDNRAEAGVQPAGAPSRPAAASAARPFDLDAYRILVKPLLSPDAERVELPE